MCFLSICLFPELTPPGEGTGPTTFVIRPARDLRCEKRVVDAMFNNLYYRGRMNAGLGCRISLCVFLLLITSHLGVRAQSGGTSTPTSAAAPAAPPDARWDLNIVNGSLRLQDGKTVPATLGNVVDYMRDMFPANIVLAPGVGQIKVGDLKLASFQWEPALDALKVASGNAFAWQRRSDPAVMGVVDPTTGLPVIARASGEGDKREELLMLTLDESGVGSGPRRIVEVFNLAGYLRGQDKDKQEKSLNEITQIIEETAFDFDPGQERRLSLRFKFHSGASLLIVSGLPGEVEVARKVVLALPETSSSKAQSVSVDDATKAVFLRRYGLNPGNTPQQSQPESPAGVISPPTQPTLKK
jgi:hypothetical protein